jgi:hypothetical protein
MLKHFQFQGPPSFTQNRIFGMKIFHLATLIHPRMTAFYVTY